jgi:hypothetical protein
LQSKPSTLPVIGNAAACVLGVMAGVLCMGCAPEGDTRPTFEFAATARIDGVTALAGVEVSAAGRALGKTNTDGTVRARLRGKEGARVKIAAKCPNGYRLQSAPQEVILRRFRNIDNSASVTRISIECAPTQRTAALVIRTRPNISILIDGKKVAHTDSDGVAHASLELPPNTAFEVTLDTSAHPNLRPRNPATRLTLLDRDEVFPVEYEFKEVAPPPPPVAKVVVRKKRRRTRKKPRRRLPERIE